MQRDRPTSQPGGGWWDPEGFWYGLRTLLGPVRLPFFRAALDRCPTAHPLVLDIGSGAGFVATELADVAEMVAIDLSSAAVRDARAAGLSAVVVADAARLPFGNATFDATICSEVLEHAADPEGVVAEAARVTVPGGLFLFSTPARTRLSRLLLVDAAQRWPLTRVLPPDLHEWGRFLSREELEGLLDAIGFTVRRLSGIGAPPTRWPGVLAALALLKLGRVSYAEAGRRIDLQVTERTDLAMIGFAQKKA